MSWFKSTSNHESITLMSDKGDDEESTPLVSFDEPVVDNVLQEFAQWKTRDQFREFFYGLSKYLPEGPESNLVTGFLCHLSKKSARVCLQPIAITSQQSPIVISFQTIHISKEHLQSKKYVIRVWEPKAYKNVDTGYQIKDDMIILVKDDKPYTYNRAYNDLGMSTIGPLYIDIEQN